jgi:hypothetical protein
MSEYPQLEAAKPKYETDDPLVVALFQQFDYARGNHSTNSNICDIVCGHLRCVMCLLRSTENARKFSIIAANKR